MRLGHLIALLITLSPAYAQEDAAPSRQAMVADLQDCAAQNTVRFDIQQCGESIAFACMDSDTDAIQCVGKVDQAWDDVLNILYQGIITDIRTGRSKLSESELRAAQRQWLQQIALDCQLIASAAVDPDHGQRSCRAFATIDRIYFLNALRSGGDLWFSP